ncbi:MAG: SET domain-containing protein-lysine N-methyltransferase [Bacteroidetes bacterium]|nr:SET domain-containing protein-lysine N-methyltransferase [Bacteroidota bacterium]MBX7044560.1 SET domain-containing protein-lysine N-methyltransferase [Ignavibacteria bacterium]
MIFELRPSPIHGVGVFAVVDIKQGELLDLFEAGDDHFIPFEQVAASKFPEKIIEKYSIMGDEGYSGPKNFHRMSIGWYLNHSDTPNAYCTEDYHFYALREIAADEEITVDYEKFE